MAQIVPLPITPPPGVVLTESDRAVEGRWILPWQWFRFMRGRPQKMGGWTLAFASPTIGTPHCIFAWTDQGINKYLAAGTYKKLYVYDNNLAQNDVTPIRVDDSETNPIWTTSGSSIINFHDPSHGLSSGDTVIILSVGSNVGGITTTQLTGVFSAITVVSVNEYTFDCGVVASSTVNGGGGSVHYQYEIPVGSENATQGLGWGVGPWGIGTWGTPRANSTIVFEPRVWTLDNFGKLLIASYNGGDVFYFDPTASQPWGRAQYINVTYPSAGAPIDCRAIFVTPERFIFALRENMIVSACSQGDYTTWTPGTTNTAWSRTLTEGNKLIGGAVLAPFVSLVWSDGALYMFQYTGSQFVYNSSLIGKDCGLVGPNARVCVGGIAYWMTPSSFMMYDGSVHPMPNVEDVRKYIFDNINTTQNLRVTALYNATYDEVWFNVAMFGSSTPNYLVVFHRQDQCWSIHQMTRCSGTHYVGGDTRPYLGDVSGYIYQHEIGNDAAGSAITNTMTLSPYALQEGRQSMDVEGIVWDFFQQSGNVQAEVVTYDRLTDPTPLETETEVVPDTNSGLSDYRINGRYIGFTLTQNTTGAYMRFGKPAAFVMPSGRRR
jgi:hypothetical protein